MERIFYAWQETRMGGRRVFNLLLGALSPCLEPREKCENSSPRELARGVSALRGTPA